MPNITVVIEHGENSPGGIARTKAIVDAWAAYVPSRIARIVVSTGKMNSLGVAGWEQVVGSLSAPIAGGCETDPSPSKRNSINTADNWADISMRMWGSSLRNGPSDRTVRWINNEALLRDTFLMGDRVTSMPWMCRNFSMLPPDHLYFVYPGDTLDSWNDPQVGGSYRQIAKALAQFNRGTRRAFNAEHPEPKYLDARMVFLPVDMLMNRPSALTHPNRQAVEDFYTAWHPAAPGSVRPYATVPFVSLELEEWAWKPAQLPEVLEIIGDDSECVLWPGGKRGPDGAKQIMGPLG